MQLKTLIVAVAVTLLPVAGSSQAPSSGERVGCQPACNKGDVEVHAPPDNPHLRAGAQFGYSFASEGDVDEASDFFLGRVEVKVLQRGRLRIPLIGNFGEVNFKEPVDAASKLRNLVNSAKGLQVMISPYFPIDGPAKGLERVVAYLNLGGKLSRQTDLQDTTKSIWARQFRASAGFDVSVASGQPRPVSLIVEGVYGYIGAEKAKKVINSTDDYLLSAEATAIVPIPGVNNLSFIAQGVAIRTGSPLWRVGTLIYAPQKAN
jgi:hypothetical protein